MPFWNKLTISEHFPNNLNISNLQRTRNEARINYRNHPCNDNLEALKSVRSQLKKSIKMTKGTFLKKLLASKNCAETWKVINKILHPNPATVKVNPDEVNKYFNETATRTTGKAAENISDEFIQTLPEQQHSFDLHKVTYDDVMKAIKNLRSDCSTGYDNIPAKFIKPVADYLVSPLTNIINHCITTSTVPSEWKISRICPVPKVMNPQTLSEYRPISILPILSKVFERVILQQLTEIIEHEMIYDQKQSGFRKGHSTTTILLKLKDDISNAMKKGEVTLAILADFSKAFDTVDYRTLLRELHTIGFSERLLYLFRDYLSNRQQLVQIDDKISKKLQVNFGVPQGSILGPVLFNLYVRTISANGKSNYLLYADDTTMLRHSKVVNLPQTINEMQHEMNKVNTWSEEKYLCLNSKKTKAILFSTPHMSKRHNLESTVVEIRNNGEPIERIADMKVLGVRFNQHLTWRNHINATTQSCYLTLKSLRRFRRSADFKLRRSLAQSLIISRINYCNVLFSDAPQYLLKKLQKLQNAAARFVYGRHTNECDIIDLKWLPVRERISLSLVKLAHKALHDETWPKYLKVNKMNPRGRNLRSENENESNIDTTGCFEGSFAHQAGKTYNELPVNIKNIKEYNKFSTKCSAYYFDKAIARVLSEHF